MPGPPLHYGAALARLHHDHFGMVARAAAAELLARLAAAGLRTGTVVDLATGSGLLAGAAVAAGYAVHGIDLSPHMLAIARAEVPAASFVEGSLWSAPLPAAVAVAAVGEAFGYAADPAAGDAALASRLREVHAALRPGGLLLFDVATPGRSGPGGERRGAWTVGETRLELLEREEGRRLRRTITLTRPAADGPAEVETHDLHLYDAGRVEQALAAAGFEVERLAGYADFRFAPGWCGWACRAAPDGGPPAPAPP